MREGTIKFSIADVGIDDPIHEQEKSTPSPSPSVPRIARQLTLAHYIDRLVVSELPGPFGETDEDRNRLRGLIRQTPATRLRRVPGKVAQRGRLSRAWPSKEEAALRPCQGRVERKTTRLFHWRF